MGDGSIYTEILFFINKWYEWKYLWRAKFRYVWTDHDQLSIHSLSIGSKFKVHLYRAKTKAKIFFDVCRFSLICFRFRLRFRSMWTDPPTLMATYPLRYITHYVANVIRVQLYWAKARSFSDGLLWNSISLSFSVAKRSKAIFTFTSAFAQCKRTFNLEVNIRSHWNHWQVAAQGRFHWANLHNGFLENYVHYIVFGIRSGNAFIYFFFLTDVDEWLVFGVLWSPAPQATFLK